MRARSSLETSRRTSWDKRSDRTPRSTRQPGRTVARVVARPLPAAVVLLAALGLLAATAPLAAAAPVSSSGAGQLVTGTGSITGLVWSDLNSNATADPSEAGIAGVTVTLRADVDSNGSYETTLGPALTDATGHYTFSNLLPLPYQATVTPRPATVPTTPVVVTLVLGNGGVGHANFGLAPAPSSLTGHVIRDQNGDRHTSPGDPAQANASVALTGTDDLGNQLILLTSTDVTGAYLFSALPPGTYSVILFPPSGSLSEGARAGTASGVAAPGRVDDIVLTGGVDAAGYDLFTLPVPPFSDVPTTSAFAIDISWVVTKGIAAGYPDGTFRPGDPVSRQAMAAFLYRYAGSPDGPAPTCSSAPFSDVAATAPFCGQITWLVGHGIASGYADGTFRPTAPVTRQAMAVFLYRLDGSPRGPHPACSSAPFTDVAATAPFCGEIAWLVAWQIASGFADGTFRPALAVSRQAMAAFLDRDFVSHLFV